MDDREDKIEKVSEELEHDLRLLGATAIEDRLQDGVPETIADLKRAGIKIWVATGDKLETAIGWLSRCMQPFHSLTDVFVILAIGHSTNLIGKESNVIIVRGSARGRPVYQQMLAAVEEYFPESGILEEPGVMNSQELPSGDSSATDLSGPRPPLRRVNTGVSSIVGNGNGDRPGGFVLVIDGNALQNVSLFDGRKCLILICFAQALGDEQHKHLLLRLAMQCEGVICCRVSPLQKALVVKLVKDGLGSMTLAIGDGANDVSMIQV